MAMVASYIALVTFRNVDESNYRFTDSATYHRIRYSSKHVTSKCSILRTSYNLLRPETGVVRQRLELNITIKGR